MLKTLNYFLLFILLGAYSFVLAALYFDLPLFNLKANFLYDLEENFHYLFGLLLFLALGNSFFRYQGKFLNQGLFLTTLLVFGACLMNFPHQYQAHQTILDKKNRIETSLRQLEIPVNGKKEESLELVIAALERRLAFAQSRIYARRDCHSRRRHYQSDFLNENYFLEQANRELFKSEMKTHNLRWTAIQVLVSLTMFLFLLAHYRKS
ncbi:MAG: hypothetical protein AAFU64_12345 [Bacteroidota bacterium]